MGSKASKVLNTQQKKKITHINHSIKETKTAKSKKNKIRTRTRQSMERGEGSRRMEVVQNTKYTVYKPDIVFKSLICH